MDSFSYALKHVFEVEGGYVNHPLDRGGSTNYGITRRTLSLFRKEPVLHPEEVQRLSKEEAAEIYFNLYWVPFGLYQVHDYNVAAAIFDQVVNRRGALVVKGIQVFLTEEYAAGLKADGVLGPLTAAAINRMNPHVFLRRFVVDCQRAYFRIVSVRPEQEVFLKGWISRTWNLLMLF